MFYNKTCAIYNTMRSRFIYNAHARPAMRAVHWSGLLHLSEFAENFGRFLRLTSQTHASGRVKCDLLLQCCKTKYLEKHVKQIVTKSATFAHVLVALERQYPTYETDLSIRAEIQNLPMLPNNPKPGRVSELLADLDHWAG